MEGTFELNEALRAIETMDTQAKAGLLVQAAQEARLLQLALDGDGDAATHDLVAELERALEQAMDAETPAEAFAARDQLALALEAVDAAGLKFRAEVGETECEGVLGTMKLPALTAVLSAQ